jgi:hypothetical protein
MSVFPIQREKLQNPAVWLATMELGHSHALIDPELMAAQGIDRAIV